MASTPTLVQTPKITPQNFVQGTDVAGTLKTLFTAGASGTKLTSILAVSTDPSQSHLLTLFLTRSAVDYQIGAVTIPANAGNNGTNPTIDFMSMITAFAGAPLVLGLPVDNDGEAYLFLESGDTLRATFATALTAGSRINVITVGGNF